MLLHGRACCFMGVHVASWACMLLHGRACCFMGVHGIAVLVAVHGLT